MAFLYAAGNGRITRKAMRLKRVVPPGDRFRKGHVTEGQFRGAPVTWLILPGVDSVGLQRDCREYVLRCTCSGSAFSESAFSGVLSGDHPNLICTPALGESSARGISPDASR